MQGCKIVFFIYTLFIRICLSQSSASPSSVLVYDEFEEKYLNAVADIVPVSVSTLKDEVLRIKTMMLPIVVASPKNASGTLSHSSAKYVLYRIFMERHGWLLEDIDMPLETTDADSAFGQVSKLFEFGGKFPRELTNLLIQHVKVYGVSTLELALFVATLEKLIDDETSQGLQRVFALKNVAIGARLYKWQAEPILQMYVACYINGFDVVHARSGDVMQQLEVVGSTYFNWEGTKKWVRTFLDGHGDSDNSTYTFEDITKIATNIVDNFVYWNNQQCSSYKERLLQMDDKGAGRVPLLDFYRDGQEKGVFFESMVYLRDLGAIDETDPYDPRVIISNYVEGPNNCVARNGYYSVCCMDECADLFSHLEASLGKSSATVEELLPVLKNLNSASMMQCREWPEELTKELYRVAWQNGGTIVLHGRSFAEYMHMAYPNECVSPRSFGPAHSITIEDWVRKSRHEIALTPESVRERIKELEGYQKIRVSKKPFVETVVKPIEKEETVDMKPQEVAVVDESHVASTLTYKFCIASAMVLAWKLHQLRDNIKEYMPSPGDQIVNWKLTELV